VFFKRTRGGARLIAVLLLAACSACEQEVLTGGQKPLNLAVAARVNGEAIYASDVELEAVARGLVRPGEALKRSRPEFAQVLDELIDQKLMAQEARARKLDADPAAARRLEMARERILGNLLVENIVAQEVNEETIEKMYAEQVALLQSNDEVSIAHILVETEADAQTVARKLAKGASFESLVLEFSRDTATRMEQGSLGYVAPNEQPAPFPEIIANTPVGEVSAPFQSDLGWHVLKVKGRRDAAPKTRAEMRPEIVSFLTLNEVSRLVRQLRTEAAIQGGDRADAAPAPPNPSPLDPAGPAPDAGSDLPPPAEAGDEL
jgi:peptidyl-prolyl cis-trans isomerase C